ncbi:MAG: hypothetical protein GY714_03330 [Desulfobacterales bacterium]|nr:hypothetical protein [Desulfobacterales bacterium]
MESIYNKDIFDDIDNKKGILAEYGNTYNDSKLPHNSLGVVNTINWLLESIGVFRLHSAFVKYKEKNILLTGKGSVGKTTSALNISFNGGELVSDDIVFIKLENDKVITFPSPKKIAITDKTIGFFTKLQKIKKTKFMHKYHLNEDFLFPNRLTKKGSPNILIFPTILNNENSGNIRIESIPKIKAFMSLLEGEILYPTISKETRKNQINLIDKLVKQSDCYFYFNGGDMKENFNLIRGIT